MTIEEKQTEDDREAVLETLDTIREFLERDGRASRALTYMEAMIGLSMMWTPKMIPRRREDGVLVWTEAE